MKEKPVDGHVAVTLKEFSPRVEDSVRRMLGSQSGRYPEPLLWQVLSIETSGCVVALTAGQGHAPHKHLMDWSTWVEPRPAQQAKGLVPRLAGAVSRQ